MFPDDNNQLVLNISYILPFALDEAVTQPCHTRLELL